MPDVIPEPAGIPDPHAPAAPSPVTTGLAPNLAAGLATLFSIVGGIVFLVLEKKDKFVRFWAMQAVFLGGLIFAFSILTRLFQLVFSIVPILGSIMSLLLSGLNLIVVLGWLVAYVISVAKSFSGQEWEIPWIGTLARQQLEKMDGSAVPPAA